MIIIALEKVTYIDGKTTITAKNLNEIQDEIIKHQQAIEVLETGVSEEEMNSAIETAIGGAIGGSY